MKKTSVRAWKIQIAQYCQVPKPGRCGTKRHEQNSKDTMPRSVPPQGQIRVVNAVRLAACKCKCKPVETCQRQNTYNMRLLMGLDSRAVRNISLEYHHHQKHSQKTINARSNYTILAVYLQCRDATTSARGLWVYLFGCAFV